MPVVCNDPKRIGIKDALDKINAPPDDGNHSGNKCHPCHHHDPCDPDRN